MDDHNDPDDNKVGYRKPPKHGRFQPGRSGNPRGRPRGPKNLAHIVEQVWSRRMRVKGPDGGTSHMLPMEVMVTQITNAAAKGDLKAVQMCLEFARMFPQAVDPRLLQRPQINISFVKMKDGKLAPLDQDEEIVEMPLEEWLKREKNSNE